MAVTIKGINGETLTLDPKTGAFTDQGKGVSYQQNSSARTGFVTTPTAPSPPGTASTDTLISILTGTMPPAQRAELDYVNQNPGMPAAQRQAAVNAVNTTAADTQQFFGGPTIKGINGETLVLDPATGSFVDPAKGVSYARGGTGWVGTPVSQAAQTPTPTPAATPTPLATSGVGEMNVPYGSDYLDPTLQLYGLLAGLQQGDKQFQQNALFNAGNSLANLYAQGPNSAAELAFLQGGMGFPAIGGSRAAVQDLIGASTRGATGTYGLDLPGGQGVSLPSTLSGQQMQGLQANPNLAGVIGSFAKAAGNPDIFRRSIEALVPSGYQSSGSGMF